jgi:hypothetical protein
VSDTDLLPTLLQEALKLQSLCLAADAMAVHGCGSRPAGWPETAGCGWQRLLDDFLAAPATLNLVDVHTHIIIIDESSLNHKQCINFSKLSSSLLIDPVWSTLSFANLSAHSFDKFKKNAR